MNNTQTSAVMASNSSLTTTIAPTILSFPAGQANIGGSPVSMIGGGGQLLALSGMNLGHGQPVLLLGANTNAAATGFSQNIG